MTSKFKTRLCCSIGSIGLVLSPWQVSVASELVPGAQQNAENHPLDLNLASSRPSIPASRLFGIGQSNSATIAAGGKNLTVTKSTILTPAQYLAASQVLQTGNQSLILGTNGSATGGGFTIASQFSNQTSSITIPAGVTGYLTNAASSLVLSGPLVNSGSMILNTLSSSMVLGASSISNLAGGVISAGNLSSKALAFQIISAGDIVNYGLISSSGKLDMLAGGSIFNTGSIVAVNSILVNAGSGSVSNAGLISSSTGNISFIAPPSTNVFLTNTDGTVQAQAGSINLGNITKTAFNVSVDGGSLLAKTINMVSGTEGSATLDVQTAEGIINVTACESHISAATSNLILGNIILAGDPSFYNTNGDLTITGTISTNGNPLALIASGNIYSKAAAAIDTSSKTGNGGNVTIIAGAEFSSTGPASAVGDSTSTLTITDASNLGGYVDLRGNLSTANKGVAITSFKTSSDNPSGANNHGGNVIIAAFAGKGENSGQISLPTNLSIDTHGHDNGSLFADNGNVAIIGGGHISMGGINASGGTGGGGEVVINTTQPNISGGPIVILDGAIQNGAMLVPTVLAPGGDLSINSAVQATGSFFASSSGFSSSAISVNHTSKTTGSITINSNSSTAVNTGALTVNGNTANTNGGSIFVTNIGDGGITVSNDISANGTGAGSGGVVELRAAPAPQDLAPLTLGGPLNLNSTKTISANGGATGSGGIIFLSGSTITSTGAGAAAVTATGAGAFGGHIEVAAAASKSTLSIGNSSGDLKLNTQSANGNGFIQISCLGNLQVNQVGILSGATKSGNGDSIFLISGAGNVLVTGSLSSNGVSSSGSGGLISIFSNSSDLFEIGNPAAINGVRGSLSASGNADGGFILAGNAGSGGVKLNSQSDLNVGNGANGLGGTIFLDASGGTSKTIGPGGTLTIPAGNYNVDAKGKGIVAGNIALLAQDLVITGGGSITLSASAPQGRGGGIFVGLYGSSNLTVGASGQITQMTATGASDGGGVKVTTKGNLTLESQAAISIANGVDGSGGTLHLSANNGTGGVLTIPAGTYSVDANGKGFAAGNIIFEGSQINLSGGTSLSLSANAPQGHGGSIRVAATAASSNLSTGAGGFITQATANGNVDGGRVFIQAGGDLTLNSQTDISVTNGADGSGGAISLISGDVLTLPGGTYAVDAKGTGQYGGSIILAASDIALSSGSNILLSANATQGAGGTISVFETKAGNLLQVGSGLLGQLSAKGSAGSGGRILLLSGGDLTVDPTFMTYSAGGTGIASGARLTFASGASGITANEILSSAWSSLEPGLIVGTGIVPDSAFASSAETRILNNINANGVDTGSGGSVYIYSNSPTLFTIGNSGVNGSNDLNVNAGANGGNGGTISVLNFGSGGVQLNSTGTIEIIPSASGNGGKLVLGTSAGTPGPVNLPNGTISADGGSAGGAGGTIVIAGSKLVHSGQLILSADSACCRSTGSISVTTTSSTSDLIVDTAINNLMLVTNEGSISVNSGRHLTVDPAGIVGENINLKAGFGNNAGSLSIDGSALCCNGGDVKLEANGDISIGTKIQANSISVLANKGGNITLLDSLQANASTLVVAAAGKISGNFLSTAELRAETTLTLAAGVDAVGGDINDLQFNGSKSGIDLATASPILPTQFDVHNFSKQANISVGGILAGYSGGKAEIKADGDINIGAVTTYGGGGSLDKGGDIHITSNTGNVMINGELDASGGSGILIQPSAGIGLSGGNIVVAAPAATSAVIINGPVITQSNTSSGNISISANTISLNNTFEDYFVDGDGDPYITASSPLFGQSAFASGTLNVTAKISGNGAVVTSTVYSANGNYSSSANTITADLTASSNPLFTVNNGSYGAITNGSIGELKAGNSVNFNGVPLGKSVNATIDINDSTRLLENGVAVTITDGQVVTPAEWVALIQLATNGAQSLILDANGAAAGGSFDLAPANLPVGGFTKLVIPAKVTANLTVPNLTVAVQGAPSTDNDGKASLNGTLTFSGPFNLSAVSFDGAGMIDGGSGSSLTITSSNGNIGTSSQIFSFVADDLTVNAGGAASTVFLTNPEGATTVHASSAGGALQISAFGNIDTAGTIASPDLRLIALAGSDGAIAINDVVGQPTGSITLVADGIGAITEGIGISLKANNLALSSGSGSIGTSPTPLLSSTSNLSANTTGTVVIINTIPVGSNTLNVLQSSGNGFDLESNSSIAVNGALSGNGIKLDSTSLTGSITINSALTATGGGTINLSADGSISDTALGVTSAGTLILNSKNGHINLGSAGATGGILNVDNLQITTGGNASIKNGLPLNLAASTIGGIFNLAAPSITSTGNVSMGSGTFNTNLLNNAFVISSNPGALTIQGLNGDDLIITGGGTLSAATTLTLSSDNGNVLFAGDQTLSANNISISAPNGAVQVDTGVVLTSNAASGYNISGVFFGNPGTQLVINSGVAATLVPISQSTTLGTIAAPITIVNPNGSINLTGSMLIGSNGKNVAIIAEGDVTATGLKTIDLSSKTGRSGNLVILAGFDFSPAPATTPLDTVTLFNNFSPAPAGGSINLAKTAINTSNSFVSSNQNRAGSILMVANAGPAGGNPGSIYLGSINSSAKAGFGGKVQLFGPGGITVNGAINTSGSTGSGSVTLAATPASSSGTILVYNGYVSPTAKFSSTGAAAGSGAGVNVLGAITTNSVAGAGAAVSIVSESQIQLSKGIITSGLSSSGPVVLNSLNGNIAVTGAINTNGVSITDTKSNSSAGNGAAVTVSAPAYISIGGISTAGGSTKGNGNGGNAGAVTISTSASGGYYLGNIAITGAINASGGNAATGKGAGGAGAPITLSSGALQVTKTITVNGVKASVISSGGTGKTAGSHAAISIDTFAVQQIPANFNLSSSTLSEIALPGGLFTIAVSPVINGTAGPVVSGATQAKTGSFAVGAGFGQGAVSIEANAGASQVIDIGGVPTLVQIGSTNATRSKITPAEALALYQVSFGNTQTLGLTPIAGKTGGQASDLNPSSSLHPSLIVIPEYLLPVAGFKSFVLSAIPGAGTASDVKLQVTGMSPVLNLSKSSPRIISGQVDFPDAVNAIINAGTSPLTVAVGAQLSSDGQLTLLGTSWTNSGIISAGAGSSPIVMLAPGKAITLTNSATGTLNGTDITIPANGMPSKFSFVNNNAAPTLPVFLTQFGYSTEAGASALNLMAGSVPTASSTLSFTMGGASGPAQLKGNVSSMATALTVNTSVNSSKAATNLSILPGTNINLSKPLTVKSSGNLAIGAGASPQAILSAAKLTISANAGTIGTTGTTLSSSSDSTMSGLTFTDNGGSNFNSSSTLSISAKSVTIGGSSASTINVAAKGIKLVTSTGALTLDNASTVTIDSGNILLQAKGAITLNSNLSAGSKGLPGTPLVDSNVAKSGSISMKSGSASSPGALNIGGGLTIEAAGTTKSPGHITAAIVGGNITFQGAGTTLRASGGNLVMLTTNDVVGASGANNFEARGIAVTAVPGAKSLGGGIEIGAGTSASKLATAVSLPSPTLPPAPGAGFIGSNVTINNGSSHGVVTATAAAALAINLSTSGAANIDVTEGGAILFQALNGKTIQMNGATFTTQAYKPISYSIGPDTEIMIEEGDGNAQLANILVPGSYGTKILYEDGLVHNNGVAESALDMDPSSKRKVHKPTRITLLAGELFINPVKTTVIDAGSAKVSINKGALALLSQEANFLRVIACSGPKDILVRFGNKQLSLSPGEELILAKHKLVEDEILKADGIGRRFSTSDFVENSFYVYRSDVSLITLLNLPYLKHVVHSRIELERAIGTRILKTAAVLGHVTNYRGAYRARSRQGDSVKNTRGFGSDTVSLRAQSN